MKVSVKKPGSPEEVLEHFGKKGMKWGTRSKSTRDFHKDNPTSGSRTQAISRARLQTSRDKANYKLAKPGVKRTELKKVYLKNPDRATAMRLTRGEKVVMALFTVGVASVTKSPKLAVAAVGIASGAEIARRRQIERSQRK